MIFLLNQVSLIQFFEFTGVYWFRLDTQPYNDIPRMVVSLVNTYHKTNNDESFVNSVLDEAARIMNNPDATLATREYVFELAEV